MLLQLYQLTEFNYGTFINDFAKKTNQYTHIKISMLKIYPFIFKDCACFGIYKQIKPTCNTHTYI